MCDGRPFASSPFRRLASRGSSIRGFPFRWAFQFALSLARCLTLQDAALSFGRILCTNVVARTTPTGVHVPESGLRCVTWETKEGLLDLSLLHKCPGKGHITTSVDLLEATSSSAYKKFMEKTSFFTLFRYWPRAPSSLVR